MDLGTAATFDVPVPPAEREEGETTNTTRITGWN
jgi:hypothetical protein